MKNNSTLQNTMLVILSSSMDGLYYPLPWMVDCLIYCLKTPENTEINIISNVVSNRNIVHKFKKKCNFQQ